jgi:RHS repeat-associated protein
MKKITLLLFVFLSFSKSYSQCSNDCVTRGVLAGIIYEIVYDQDDPDNYQPMVNYPTAYLDGTGDAELDKKISLVSYLDYNDGVRTLGHMDASGYFIASGIVGRGEALVALMEAWDIQPDFTGSVSYNDVDSNHEYYGYINEAEDLDLLDGLFGSNFNSNYGITSTELVTIIVNIQNTSYHPVSTSTLQNPNNYFTPNNYQPDNIGTLRGLEQGVFSHYAKNSYVIPDIKFNLNFSHYYSTQMVELPQSYFPIQPLSRGWTHTYNAYIVRENNVGADEIDYYYIKWADGSVDIFNEDDEEYVTLGVYDELEENVDGFDIVITKKNQTKYFFDRYGIPGPDEPIYYLEKIEDSNGNTIVLSYEESDVDSNFARLETVTAPSGKELDFHYHNNTDFIDFIEDPIGRQIRFTYNEERLKYFYDAKDQETKYYYVSNDEDAPDEHQYKRFLLRRVKLPNGNSIRAEYDDNDNGKLESYWINDVETLIDVDYSDYEAITSRVEVPMPNGGTQDFDYEFNINGMVTEYHNDTQDINISYPSPTNDNPLLPTNVDINGLDIDYDYDDRGNVTDIQVENNEDKDFWYDNDNNLIQYRDENDNSTYFNYDSNNNLTSIEDALGNFIYFSYDGYGQVTSVTNQEGITVNYTYDDGVVTSISAPEGLESSFNYDGINRLLSQTINGQTTSFVYDNNDNLTSHTNIGGLTTTFDYDANDNLITITNANGVDTSFTYNTEDQVTSENFNGLTKQYEYNDDGTLHKYTKPSGDIIEYDYLSNGKLNEAGTITDIDYYGSSGGKKEGLLRRIYNDNGHYEFDYNNLNRLDHVRDEYNLEDIYYEYDNVGNITEIDYPDKGVTFSVHYDYDAKNRMTRVRARIDGSYTTIAEYEYRDDDLLKRVEYGNGISNNNIYDNAGRKTGLSYAITNGTNGGPVLFSEGVTLDNRGNILSDNKYYLEEENSPTLPLQASTYTYNQNNHLTSVNGLPVVINDDGNTTSRQVESNGAGIPDATISYTYDLDDRLTNVNSSNTISGYPLEYEYDVYGNRVKRFTNNGSNYQYYTWDVVNNNVILEESNIEDDIYYVYGATGLEVSINAQTGDIIYYYLGDLRGSVIATVEENNQNYEFNKYNDFGNLTKGNYGTTSTESFKYLGKYGITLEQLDLGHYYIKARHYDAGIGRFLTQDPIWSTNLYPYSNNNPISNIDRNGKNYFNYNYTNYQQELFAYTSGIAQNFNDASERIARHVFNNLERQGLIINLIGGGLALTKAGAPIGVLLAAAGRTISIIGGIGNGALDVIIRDDNSKIERVLAFEAFEFVLNKTLKHFKALPEEIRSAELFYQILTSSIDEYYND